jgi:hypothetical protein
MEPDGEAKKSVGKVPVASIFNTHKIPAKDAAKLKRVVDKMLSEKKIDNDDRWQAMVRLAEDYLGK